AMLRTLLEDRFALRAHMDTRRLPALALTTARGDRSLGPSLKRSAVQCPATPSPDRWCGFRHTTGVVEAQAVTMAEVATYFGPFAAIRRPLEDRTELKERYDFHLEF